MAQGVPENQKLYDQILNQAKAKYPSHRRVGATTPAANNYVTQQYSAAGGKYVDSKKQVPPQFVDVKKNEEDAEKRKKQQDKRKRQRQGLI